MDDLDYCIQLHDSSNLHYDLRLEYEGVAKSWAVPKEPPLESGVKRLAIMTEDHSLGYMSFEGVIPEDQYGGGSVELWDEGSWSVKEFSEDKIVGFIDGEKLSGEYVLVHMEDDKWLFFKKEE